MRARPSPLRESAMSRDAGAFQDGRATPQVEVRWHNGETAACP